MDTIKNNNFKDTLIKNFIFILSIVGIWLLLKYLGSLFTPFIIAYLFSLLLYPIFNILNSKYKIHSSISGIICIFGFLFIIYLLGFRIIYQLIQEAKSLNQNFPYYIESFTVTINNLIESFKYSFFNVLGILPESIKNSLMQIIYNFQYILIDFISSFVSEVSVESIKNIPNLLTTSIIAIISTYLFLTDKKNIEEFIRTQISKDTYSKVVIIKNTTGKAVIGYLKAQLIIMSIIMLVCFIGLMFVKVPYSFLIAFIIGIIDALPIFGSGAILWPWAVYNLITQNYYMAIALITIYIIIFILRQVVEPKVLGKQIGLHPLATLISVYVGFQVMGLVGLILAPIILVVIISLNKQGVFKEGLKN